MQTLAELGEDALLRHLAGRLPPGGCLRVGPGDDCAVVGLPGGGFDLLLKTDCVVEGVHFEPGTAAPRVGRKALARVLSDIAAMGGEPGEVLVTLVLPPALPAAWVDGFYDGLLGLAGAHGVRVAGGELAAMPGTGPVVVNVAATGRVAAGQAVLRGGGRPGDLLAVTGLLGNSFASGWHLDFIPRLEAGRWLAGRPGLHAMMDLSDGLARDLPRLAAASGCGFTLEPARLPLRAGATREGAQGDGEDYELLLAVAPDAWPALAAAWPAAFPGLPLTRIGALAPPSPGPPPPAAAGWDAFQPHPPPMPRPGRFADPTSQRQDL
jgi:thiamine-monophosphate kinase